MKKFLNMKWFRSAGIAGFTQRINSATSAIKVTPGSELEEQIRFTGITVEDLALANALQPIVAEHIQEIVDAFYAGLVTSSESMAIILKHSSIDRLKESFQKHVIALFAGVIDASYIAKRHKVAQIHVRIGLSKRLYIASFQGLSTALTEVMDAHLPKRKDFLRAIRTINKLLNLEQQIVLESYDQEITRLIRESTADLTERASETDGALRRFEKQSSSMLGLSQTGSGHAEEAESKSAEGKTHIDRLNAYFQDLIRSMDGMLQDLHVLNDRASKIGDIVEIVEHIADQTQLLSLNAAIEAARAGEQGKGFTVVAGEVGKLADKTKQSVSDVADLIKSTTNQIQTISASIATIHQFIGDGASSIDIASGNITDVVTAMKEAKAANRSIERELGEVSTLIAGIGQASAAVMETTNRLNHMVKTIK